jgi:hypothetical protein
LILRAPTSSSRGQELLLAAVVEPAQGRRRELRIGIDAEYGEWADSTVNPFVPLATLYATALGEDLTVETPASARLVAGAEQASALFAAWWGYRAARIEAPVQEPAPRGEAVAALFSGGLDTSATLIRSLGGDIDERATHLITMYGSEFRLSPRVQDEIFQGNVRAAAEYGLPLIRVTTNAQRCLRSVIGWPRTHGAAFASLGLALGPLFRTVLVGASQLPDAERPHGSRPELDPLWSTEATTIRHDGAELGKLGRAEVVARSPIALNHLTVCWKVDTARNCGRCEKCLRTMTCLEVANALEKTDRFDAPLTPEAVRACEPTRSSSTLIEELVADIPDSHAELRAAWEEKLREARAVLRAERRRERWTKLRRGATAALRRK